MNANEPQGDALGDSSNVEGKEISRREFVDRLSRVPIYAAPVVAAVTLMTPKAHGY
jgi:hypothetical protein